MPHLVLAGELDLEAAGASLGGEVRRWGRAVLKTDGCWVRLDGRALLVEGVVVEYSRPQHPVSLVAPHHGDTIVRLWPVVPVERTKPVQRWLCQLAADLQGLGAGPVRVTNIPDELWSDLDLEIDLQTRSER